MISKNEPLSMQETDDRKDLVKFIKSFTKLSEKDARSLRKKLEELNLMKLKNHDIAKVIEILPLDEDDLNKIFTEIRLDEDESKKVLDAIKEFI